MLNDWWITAEEACAMLREGGYETKLENGISYKKLGVSGRIHIHNVGVDGWAVMRLLDKGS
jgi:hypothetical protein